MNFPILSALIFLPAAGGLAGTLFPRSAARMWALGVSAIELILAVYAGFQFTASGAVQFTEAQPWIPGLGLNYTLGADGVSVFLVILTALLTFTAISVSAEVSQNSDKPRLFYFLMLFLATGIQGVFLAQNAFLFYVFWEVMLVPAYLLVGTFGGPRRTYAAIKFVLYTAVGSLLMLAGVIGLNAAVSGGTGMSFAQLAGHVPANAQLILFLAFAAAFAVKSPLFPFHSWAPDAYTEAPAPVTVMLAGAMSKTGVYGFLRFGAAIFPQAAKQAAPYIAVLAVIGILYSAVQALTQSDMKRLLAYSSISHMNVIILGIFALNTFGLEGSVLQMLNHGVTTGALFIIAGYIESRYATRSLRRFGGMARQTPVLAVVFCIAALSSLGLPGLNSFSGEFLTLLGAFQANAVLGALATLVIIPAAWYMLQFFQGVMEGPESDIIAQPNGTAAARAKSADISFAALLPMLLLIALMLYIGLAPAFLPDRIGPTLTQFTALSGQFHASGLRIIQIMGRQSAL